MRQQQERAALGTIPGPVHEVLSALPEEDALAVALACWGGYRCSTIADALCVPSATIARRIRAGLLRLEADRVQAGRRRDA